MRQWVDVTKRDNDRQINFRAGKHETVAMKRFEYRDGDTVLGTVKETPTHWNASSTAAGGGGVLISEYGAKRSVERSHSAAQEATADETD